MARPLLRRPGPSRGVRSRATLALLGCWAGACGPARPAGPALVVADPVADLGAAWEGARLAHEFLLTSGGDTPVAIVDRRADCGCTVARLERLGPGGERAPYVLGEPLAPGERLAVPVEVETRGRPGRTPRTVHLVQEHGAVLALSVVADVRPWLVAEPASLPPLSVPEGRSGEVRFAVRQAEDRPVALRASRAGLPPWVEVEVTPAGPGTDDGRARRFDVRVRVTADAPRGTRGYAVRLETDEPVPGAPPLEDGTPPVHHLLVELAVEVLGPVSLRPPSLGFGVVRPRETVSRTVRLTGHDPAFELPEPRARLEPVRRDEPFPLAAAASLRTRRVAGENAWDVELVLSDLDESLRGNFLARLVVETGHPRLPELEASVLGVALGEPGGGR